MQKWSLRIKNSQWKNLRNNAKLSISQNLRTPSAVHAHCWTDLLTFLDKKSAESLSILCKIEAMTIVNIAIYLALPSLLNLKGHGMETTACHAHLMSCPQKRFWTKYTTWIRRVYLAPKIWRTFAGYSFARNLQKIHKWYMIILVKLILK